MSNGFWNELGRLYRGPRAWLARLATVYVFLFFALTIWAAVGLLEADTTRDQILCALGVLLAFGIAAACKMYLYMQMDRNALEDRLRRIEQLLDRS